MKKIVSNPKFLVFLLSVVVSKTHWTSNFISSLLVVEILTLNLQPSPQLYNFQLSAFVCLTGYASRNLFILFIGIFQRFLLISFLEAAVYHFYISKRKATSSNPIKESSVVHALTAFWFSIFQFKTKKCFSTWKKTQFCFLSTRESKLGGGLMF